MSSSPVVQTGIRRISSRGLVRFFAAVAFLLLVMLTELLCRAGQESSIWRDEIYSILLAQHDAARLVEFAKTDTHPPLYYLALKAWLAGLRLCGIEAGVAWARAMNVLLWLGGAAWAWLFLRRRLGNAYGLLCGLCVAVGAQPAYAALNIRSYGMAAPLLLGCFLVLVARYEACAGERKHRVEIGSWVFFALCAATAMWSHLLSLVALAALGVVWLAMLLSALKGRTRFGIGGGLALIAAFAAFTPWLSRLQGLMQYLGSREQEWMTPATALNALRVFFCWYPFGETRWTGGLWLLLGGATLAAPLAAGFALRRRPRPIDVSSSQRAAALLAWAGLVGPVLFVAMLWSLRRFFGIQAFHGPRYPLLAASWWACGIGGLACWCGMRADRRSLAWIVAAPWIVASLVGQTGSALDAKAGGLGNYLMNTKGVALKPGDDLFAFPSFLLPYFRKTLGAYRTLPLDEAPAVARPGSTQWALDLNTWAFVSLPEDDVRRQILQTESVRTPSVASRSDWIGLPAGDKMPLAWLARLDGFQPRSFQALWDRHRQIVAEREQAVKGIAVAEAEKQAVEDGWSPLSCVLLFGDCRSNRTGQVVVRFDRPLPPGKYLLHYVGIWPKEAPPGARIGFALERSRLAQKSSPYGLNYERREGRGGSIGECPEPRPGPFCSEIPLAVPREGGEALRLTLPPGVAHSFGGAWVTRL